MGARRAEEEGRDVARQAHAGGWSLGRPGPRLCFAILQHPSPFVISGLVAQTAQPHLELLTHPGWNKYFLMKIYKNCNQSYWKNLAIWQVWQRQKASSETFAICGLLSLYKMYISYLPTSAGLGFIKKSAANTLPPYEWRLIVCNSRLIQGFRYL